MFREEMLALWRTKNKDILIQTSGQDGAVGRYTLFPHTTKRRTTNLKTKDNQNCQKIELHGSPITKELKKKNSSFSSRRGGDRQAGQRGHMAKWRFGQSHIRMRISLKKQLGSKTDHVTQGSSKG